METFFVLISKDWIPSNAVSWVGLWRTGVSGGKIISSCFSSTRIGFSAIQPIWKSFKIVAEKVVCFPGRTLPKFSSQDPLSDNRCPPGRIPVNCFGPCLMRLHLSVLHHSFHVFTANSVCLRFDISAYLKSFVIGTTTNWKLKEKFPANFHAILEGEFHGQNYRV